MRNLNINRIRALTARGKANNQRKILNDVIKHLKRSARSGDTYMKYIMRSDEDVVYCAEYLKQKGL